MFGRKSADRVNQLVAIANRLSSDWTKSPDSNEFFARFMRGMGYCLFSWEKGAAVIAKSPKLLIVGIAEVLASIRSDGQSWQIAEDTEWQELAGLSDPRSFIFGPRPASET